MGYEQIVSPTFRVRKSEIAIPDNGNPCTSRQSVQENEKRMIQVFKPKIREEAVQAVAKVLRSGWIGLGPKTEEFERAFGDYVGVPFCVGLNSCTAALHLGVSLMGLKPGTEVITTPVTFVSTNHVLLYEHLKPVFADINPKTGNLDIGSVKNKITPDTGAIMLVHYGGYPCDLDEFYNLARRHHLQVVEDCAHACGAAYKGRRVGSHGNIHAFSFHAVKNLPMGEGGALTVRLPEHYARLRRLRWLGIDKDTFHRSEGGGYSWEYNVPEVGWKHHMSDIQAAVGLAQLPYLEEDNRRRAEMVGIYRSQLAGVPGITLPALSADRTSSNHLCWVLANDRDRLAKKLKLHGVGVSVHYRRNDSYPMYTMSHLPNTEYFTSHVLSLPLHLHLSDEDILYVTSCIREGW